MATGAAPAAQPENLQVHHVVSLEDGGAEFELSNLRTLCRDCHGRGHRVDRAATPSHPLPIRGETHNGLEPLVG